MNGDAASMPPVRYTETADGMRIAYVVAGQGHPVVVLPFHQNHIERRWIARGLTSRLAEHFRVTTYDSRGQGLSSRSLNRVTPADYRADLEAVLQAAGLDSAVIVAYGGFAHVALRYAADNPGRVEALVLILHMRIVLRLAAWRHGHAGRGELGTVPGVAGGEDRP
jgi:pimeloyl-ACP methyl ester carboxylesterase